MADMPALRGSIDGNYSHVDGDDDVSADEWGINGHLLLPVAPNFNIQGDGGYANIHGDGQDIDGWDISGAAFFRNERGTIGVAIAYANLDSDDDFGATDADVTAYGAFGELFLGDFTLSARGGWFDADNDLDGNYWGAGAKFYVMPDFSVSGGVDQIHLNHLGHVTDWNVGAEWQVTNRMPLSFFGSYNHSDLSDSDFSFDTWTVGIRWRFGEEPGTTLMQGDRTNVVPNTTVSLANAIEF
jgi:hypothetical protein